jgi:hypothetical protein
MDSEAHRVKLKSHSVQLACKLFRLSVTNLPPSNADLVRDLREDTQTSLTLLIDLKRQLYDTRSAALGSQRLLTNDIERLLERINEGIERIDVSTQPSQARPKN